jgi:saccharopine dehydrogenase (NAD+, L-lysine-forming)
MIFNNTIYIRSELNTNEYRTPIIPSDIKLLINNGFIIYVEKSINRIFINEEYEKNGAILTDKPWYDKLFKNSLIIGLKEFDNIDKLDNHEHLYFSHTYKNQDNSYKILKAFYDSDSIIYDFEYFINKNNFRLISFGFYAGIVGCALGLLQYLKKDGINNLKIWTNEKELIDDILKYDTSMFNKLKIGIIGANGKCGSGIKYLLNKLLIKYIIIDRSMNIKDFLKYDIFYNAILLDNNYNNIFFDKNTVFEKKIIIVDISCDNLLENNPIKLYKDNTNWKDPVYKYNEHVDIISINNLPSLLPRDSSIYFSKTCVQLLLQYNNDKYNYWNNLRTKFYEKLLSIV